MEGSMIEAVDIGKKASDGSIELLEQRVQRLEDAVGTMQDTRSLEDRVATRVADRLTRASAGEPKGMIIEAGRRLLPTSIGPFRSEDLSSSKSTWLLIELYNEVRAIFWMFLDTQYRVGWTCRLLPFV